MALNRSGPILARAAPALVGGILTDLHASLTLRAGPKQAQHVVATARRFIFAEHISRPDQVTTLSIRRYLAGRLAAGKSLKTLHNERAALSALCQILDQPTNAALAVKLRRLEKLFPHWLTKPELLQCLELAKGQDTLDTWCAILFDASTGLRLGELIRLRWLDIDWPAKQLTVRKAKGRRSRALPLNRSALLALRVQRRRTGRFQWVFPARQTWAGGWKYTDRPRHCDRWFAVLRPIADRVPKFQLAPAGSASSLWHLFRHSWASWLAQGDTNVKKLQEWGGWADLASVEVYAHLRDGYDPQIEAASILGVERAGAKKGRPGAGRSDQTHAGAPGPE